MSLKVSTTSEIHKILVISLSNIGDVVLTFPAIDIIKKEFPSAQLSIVIGPKADSLLKGNPAFNKVHIFDKHQSPLKSLAWIHELRKERYDLVVDFRNTAIPLMISPQYRTSYRSKKMSNIHMRQKHIDRLKTVYAFERTSAQPCSLFVSSKDKDCVDGLIDNEMGGTKSFAVMAPGAADVSKRWSEEKFAFVCDYLIKECGQDVCFVGSEEDRKGAAQINKLMEADGVNLCGRTNLVQLAELFKRCFCAIVNDSAPMHIASYVDTPVLALFGPTNPYHYGPWSTQSCFLRKNEACRACESPKQHLTHSCMDAISVEDCLGMLQKNIFEDKINFEQ